MSSLCKSIVLVYFTGVSAAIGAQLLGFSVLSLSTIEATLAVFASAGVLLMAVVDYKPRHPPYTVLSKDVLESSLRPRVDLAPALKPFKATSHR